MFLVMSALANPGALVLTGPAGRYKEGRSVSLGGACAVEAELVGVRGETGAVETRGKGPMVLRVPLALASHVVPETGPAEKRAPPCAPFAGASVPPIAGDIEIEVPVVLPPGAPDTGGSVALVWWDAETACALGTAPVLEHLGPHPGGASRLTIGVDFVTGLRLRGVAVQGFWQEGPDVAWAVPCASVAAFPQSAPTLGGIRVVVLPDATHHLEIDAGAVRPIGDGSMVEVEVDGPTLARIVAGDGTLVETLSLIPASSGLRGLKEASKGWGRLHHSVDLQGQVDVESFGAPVVAAASTQPGAVDVQVLRDGTVAYLPVAEGMARVGLRLADGTTGWAVVSNPPVEPREGSPIGVGGTKAVPTAFDEEPLLIWSSDPTVASARWMPEEKAVVATALAPGHALITAVGSKGQKRWVRLAVDP